MLFGKKDIEISKEVQNPNFEVIGQKDLKSVFLEGTDKKELQLFSSLLPDYQVISYYTKGVFSTHEVINSIIRYLGSVDQLSICTWSISETSVRTLDRLKKEGLIGRLAILVDYRVPHHTPAPYEYLKNIADYYNLANTHAKVAIFSRQNEHLFLQTTSNLSQNNRIEVGTLFKINELALFHRNWILNEINKKGE